MTRTSPIESASLVVSAEWMCYTETAWQEVFVSVVVVSLRRDPMAESENSSGSALLFGAYVLGDKIGEGTFGTVYKAQHFTLPKRVCIKIIHRNLQSEQQELIFREAH